MDRRCSVREVPQHRIDLGYSVDHYFDPRERIPGRISSAKAGFIEHPERFDPVRFGLTPRDAAVMEPQARMMLEVTWDAIEDAGIPFEALRGERVAVIVGHTAEDFSRERIAVLGEDYAMRSLDVRTAIGYARAAISGRISHLLDLRGPSMTVDTACSSSLYATHQACQSLWVGESRMALAGGVNLFLTPEGSLALSRSGMMAGDGCCKAFDARADGFVRAEGAGAVLLRPLADALEEGDRIYAVIRGTGISADGRDGGHMMAPGREGQAQAMRDAYDRADLLPGEVDFLEAHGTGTPIGDPVEAASLGDVMGEGRAAGHPLRISSIKGNIGHAESASGMAGLIKAALAVQRRVWPGQLHFETPNPAIDWENLPVEVQVENAPWPHQGIARAAVNSFGISGTNAHVVLESAPSHFPESELDPEACSHSLIPLSAHEPAALDALATQYLGWLRDEGRAGTPGVAEDEKGAVPARPRFEDLAYTLARRKSHFSERLAIVADSVSGLVAELEGYLAGEPSSACLRAARSPASHRPLVFVFPGQGGQWWGMARDLLETEPEFRAQVEAWDEAFRPHVDWSLIATLSGNEPGKEDFDDLAILQPVLVALQASLADWLIDRGARPQAVIGQSVGEIPAAYVAGILSREDAARLACLRGAAVARAAGRGAMGLVGLSEEETLSELGAADRRVEIAGQSAPGMTLVAGDREDTLTFLRDLAAREIFARPLDVDFASHCFHMDPLLADFSLKVGELSPAAGDIPFYSSVCGRHVPGETLGIEYWVKNLREQVRFVDAVLSSMGDSDSDYVEISPHPTGVKAIVEIAESAGSQAQVIETLRRGQSGKDALLRALAALFVRGHELEMNRLHPSGKHVSTPLYSNQLRTLWFGRRRRHHLSRATHPLLGPRRQDADDERCFSWEILADKDSVPAMILAEGKLNHGLPVSLCAELAMAAAADLVPGRPVEINELVLSRSGSATSPPPDARFAIQVRGSLSRADQGEIQVFVQPQGKRGQPWQSAASASFRVKAAAEGACSAQSTEKLDAARLRCRRELSLDWPRAVLERNRVAVPRRLDPLRSLHLGNDEFIARLDIPAAGANEIGHFYLHPLITEKAMALAGSILLPGLKSVWGHSVAHLFSSRRCDETVLCHAKLEGESQKVCLDFFSAEGEPIVHLEGLGFGEGTGSRRATAMAPVLVDIEGVEPSWLAESEAAEQGEDGAAKVDSEAALAWGLASLTKEKAVEGSSGTLVMESVSVEPMEGGASSIESARNFVAQLDPNDAKERRVRFCVAPKVDPGVGEVLVEAHSVPLSQLDIRHALGLMERDSEGLGREFSGVVRALGAGVSHLEPGDRVFGLARGAMASRLVVSAEQVVRIPRHLAPETAATLLLPFLVAHRVLGERTRIEPGTRVLLLVGAGGVGLALARLASRKKARLLALASNPARREALLQSGASGTFRGEMDSFREEALAWSGGEGFDVVISSLDDPRIESAAELLASGGTFVDLRPPGARAFAKFPSLEGNRYFATFDFDAWLRDEPEAVASSLHRIAADLETEEAPPLPTAIFPVGELQRAIRFASQNRFAGRVMLDMRDRHGMSLQAKAATARFSAEPLHWLSGSNPALIEAHLLWLYALGARRFVVHSKRVGADMRERFGEHRALGDFDIEFAEGALRPALADGCGHFEEIGSLSFVCDAAFTSADEIQEGFVRFREADLATRDFENVPFLLSVCARDFYEERADGEARESAAAARVLRLFADATCRKRRKAGLRAASLAFADPIREAESFSASTRSAMESLAFEGQGRDGVVLPLDAEDRRGLSAKTLELLGPMDETKSEGAGSLRPLDLAELGSAERRKHLQVSLLEFTAAILAISSEGRARFDTSMPLVDLGLDSLMAAELSIQIEKETGQALTAQIWATRPGLNDLVDYLCRAIEDEREGA